MSYPFVQGIDYGPRSGTRGLSFHMSEGGDGLVGFLRRHAGEDLWEWADRVNGVSCHAAILSTGSITRMLGWSQACGNLNPDDRAGEYGYYGHHHLVDVLGRGWANPNEWTISAELAGRRLDGPTKAQAFAAIDWGLEMVDRYPSIRGATGHHDQSPKGCPGVKPNMKMIFTELGGHGLWTPEQEPQPQGEPEVPALTYRFIRQAPGTVEVISDGDSLIALSDCRAVPAPRGTVRESFAFVELLKPLEDYLGRPNVIGDRIHGYVIGRLIPEEPANIEAAFILASSLDGPTVAYTPATPAADPCVGLQGRIDRAIGELQGSGLNP